MGRPVPRSPTCSLATRERSVAPSAGAEDAARGPGSPISHGTPSPLQPSRCRDGPAASAGVQAVVSHQQTFLALTGASAVPQTVLNTRREEVVHEAWWPGVAGWAQGHWPLLQLCSPTVTLSQQLSPSAPQFPRQH